MKSPFAESCTLLFIFCIFSTKTFDCSRNFILRSSELLFSPFRSLSGGKIELSEFISAGFSKLQLFCPVDIHMKKILARMCTFCSFFGLSAGKTCEYSRKNIGRSVKAAFSGSRRTLCKKTFALEPLTIFRSISDFEPKNFVFQWNHFSRVLKTAMFNVHETLRGNIGPLKKLRICSFFPAFWPNKI